MKKILMLLVLVISCMKNVKNLSNEIKGLDEDLLEAVIKNDKEKVEDLIRRGANINSKDINGNKVLMLASRAGNIELVKYLIEKGANVNGRNKYGSTALIEASSAGNIELVKHLVEKGAIVNYETISGSTALTHASDKGNIELVKYLVEKGADVNGKNNSGSTALIAASRVGNIDLVKYLVEEGANINDKDNDGWTALMLASRAGNIELVKYLVEKEANVNGRNKYGSTALMLASSAGNIELVKYLIEKGADVNDRNKYGSTALIYASEKGYINTLKYLVEEKGANVNDKNNSGLTALILASSAGNIDLIKYLVEGKGANVNDKDRLGSTALIESSHKGHTEIVKYLVEKGANVNDKDKRGATALSLASTGGYIEIVKIMLENSCEINKEFNLNNIVEKIVIDDVKNNKLESCLLIINNCKNIIDFNYKDLEGNTFLHYVAMTNNYRLFNLFLNNSNVDINLLNNKGETPLYFALSVPEFKEDFIWYLLNKGAVLKPISHINGKNLVDILLSYEKLCDKIVCEPLVEKLSGKLTLTSNQKSKIIEVIKKIKLKDSDFREEKDLTSFISNILKFYNNLEIVEDASILEEDLNDVDLNIKVFDAIFKNFTTDDYWDEVKANLEYNISTFMDRLEDIKNAPPVPKPSSKSSLKDKALYMTFKAKKQLHKLLSYISLTVERGKNNDKIIFGINQILAELVCRGGSLEAIDLAVNTFTGESSNELKYDISLLILNLRKQLLKEAARGKCTVRGYYNVIEQVDPENPHLLIHLCNSFTNELKLPIEVDEFEYNFIYNKGDILKDFKKLYNVDKVIDYMASQIDHVNNTALWNKVKDYIERDIFKGRAILEVDDFLYDDEYKIKKEALISLLLHFNLLK